MNNKLWTALLVLLAVPTLAGAAGDEPWSGFYAGVSVGAARHAANWSDNDFYIFGATLTNPYYPALAGITAGYNYQSGSLVYGAEVDWSKGWSDNTVEYYRTEGATEIQKTDKLKDLLTVRGRVGVAVDNGLFYLSAGLATPKAEHTWTDRTFPSGSWTTFSNSKLGYAIGIGFEHKIGERFSWKFEYLNIKNRAETAVNGSGFRIEVDEVIDVFRVGANYKF